jgi:hypothetical protein
LKLRLMPCVALCLLFVAALAAQDDATITKPGHPSTAQVKAAVRAVRASYCPGVADNKPCPVLAGNRELTNKALKQIAAGLGIGLLKKTSGNHCLGASCDFLCSKTTGHGWDVFVDWESTAGVAADHHIPSTPEGIVDTITRCVSPNGTAPTPPPPVTTPCPTCPCPPPTVCPPSLAPELETCRQTLTARDQTTFELRGTIEQLTSENNALKARTCKTRWFGFIPCRIE